MFYKDKPKGLPGTRGIGYLVTGIVIGVVGVLGVMFFLTLPACACMPQPTETTLTSIATPVPGVTGTVAAQTVSQKPYLRTFAVSEDHNQIALSYGYEGAAVLDIRPWLGSGIDHEAVTILERSGMYSDYEGLSWYSAQPQLAAFSVSLQTSNIFDVSGSPSPITPLERLLETIYSPQGQWLAAANNKGDLFLHSAALELVGSTTTEGKAYTIAFSADEQMLAVLSSDWGTEGRRYIEVFAVPSLEVRHRFTLDEFLIDDLVFSSDGTQLAAATAHGVRVFSLVDDTQRYFDVPDIEIQTLTIDPSGSWLAVGGGGSDFDLSGKKGVYLFSLAQASLLSASLSKTQFLSTESLVIGLQFVNEGLLIGDSHATLMLYTWPDDMWRNPTVVMTAADLE